MNKKQFKKTNDLSKELMLEITDFFKKTINKCETEGDVKLISFLTFALYEQIGFYNEKGETIEVKVGE